MARTVRFSQVLWIVTTAWLAACGRIGFGEGGDRAAGGLPDAAVGAKPPGDGAINVPDAQVAVDAAPKGPIAVVNPPAAVGTICGGTADTFGVDIKNTGDQDLVLTDIQATNGFKDITGSPASVVVIGPGNTINYLVGAPSAVVGTDIGGTQKTGELQMMTNVPGATNPMRIPLVANVIGANIASVTVSHGAGNNLVFEANSTACPAQQSIAIKLDHVDGGVDLPIQGVNGFVLSGFSGGTVASDGTQTMLVDVAHPNTCASGATINLVNLASGTTGICKVAVTKVNLTFNFSSGSSTCFCS